MSAAAAPPNKGKGPANPSHLMPTELIDRCIGSRLWIILKGARWVAAALVCTHGSVGIRALQQ
jgi:hypothetical protein